MRDGPLNEKAWESFFRKVVRIPSKKEKEKRTFALLS